MIAEKMDSMIKVLDMLEKKLKNRRVIRYMIGREIIDISAEQFFCDIRKRAYGLRKRGLAGKHIGIIGRNSYEWLVNFCAIFRAGSVGVLLDRELDALGLRDLPTRVNLEAIIYDASVEEKVMQAELPEKVNRISMNESYEGETMEDGLLLNQSLATGADDLSCIFFTSGTTIKSKAVMMSGQAMAASICTNVNNKPFDSLLSVMPFHHLAGFVTVMNALYLGAEVCIAEDLKYFYRYLEYMKPDYAFLVPSMLQMLARKLKNGGTYGSKLGWNLKMIDCGGAVFCSEFLQMLLNRGITVMQGYGASEAGGIGFFWEMTPERPNTIGKPPAELEIKIVDGEVYLRSQSLMMGYYDDPAETAKVLRDGWYATGDLGYEDKDGYFYLTGRRKNLIILSNGENVSPEEIESKLQIYEEVEEVIVGVEDNVIVATIFPPVWQDSSMERCTQIRENIEKVVDQYNCSVPLYKQIRKIHIVDKPLKKNTAGKIIRHKKTGDDV